MAVFRAYRPLMISLLTLLALTGCDAYTQSPTGRKQVLLFSEQDMAAQGQQRFEQMRAQLPQNRNASVNAYVNCIVTRLVTPLDTNRQWQVQVFKSHEANAFALPGGYIGIYDGMLKLANTQDELAAVLAHEIAHVLSRHGNEQVSRGEMKGLGLNVANLVLDVAEVENRDLVMAALDMGTELGLTLPFSRAQETEADTLGMVLMAQAGFNPQAAVTLWQKMDKMSASQPLELLSTHPSADSRITDLQALQPRWQGEYQQALAKNPLQCR
ncbi:M48 family metallopeptidase [Shewanella sp. SNU WT4]|uniref:M48 family metallopeptidase n=1 Tax=Shewanella sp. SNU WT4 TaxID=2590015 RepID=UPI001F0E8F54|nr:M48 family metallopeptidase [Shewanella sp. SNU WT4]